MTGRRRGFLVSLVGTGALALTVWLVAPMAAAASDQAAQRQREEDDLRRQDVARDLMARGQPVRWQERALGELLDWRDRIDAARALAVTSGVRVDWRAASLETLNDLRLRAAKAAQLRATYGVTVDWRHASWLELERLRLSLAALHAGPSVASADGPGGNGLLPFDPSRRYPRVVRTRPDPDGIIYPAARLRSTRLELPGPDGIARPTFASRDRRPTRVGPDDLIEPRF